MKKVEELINSMKEIRDKKTELNNKIKELNSQWSDIEAELIDLMKEQGIEKISSAKATASLNIGTYFSVKDKEVFYQWAVDNGRFEMLQSRINNAPAVEMLENEGIYPDGTEPYIKEKISLRTR